MFSYQLQQVSQTQVPIEARLVINTSIAVSLGYSSVFPLCIEKYWAQRSISLLLGNNSAVMVKCSDKVQPVFIPGIEKQ